MLGKKKRGKKLISDLLLNSTVMQASDLFSALKAFLKASFLLKFKEKLTN